MRKVSIFLLALRATSWERGVACKVRDVRSRWVLVTMMEERGVCIAV